VATLTASGVPLAASARLDARVTAPNGSFSVVPMQFDQERYTASIPTTISGVYEIHVVAQGSDLHGAAFTREEVRCLAVWARGDDPPPLTIDRGSGGGINLCDLLLCLTDQRSVRAALERHGVDPSEVEECVTRACQR
jgi:hypothetical protein